MGYSQTYTFNIFLKYHVHNNNNSEFDIHQYANEDDPSYIMSIEYGDVNVAKILDFKNEKTHIFYVTIDQVNGLFKFKKIESERLSRLNVRNVTFHSQFDVISEDNSGKMVRMKKDWDIKALQYDVTTLKIHNYNKNLFYIYRHSIHGYVYRTDLDPQLNGFVESAVTTGKYPSTMKLMDFKKVDFQLTVPVKR